jgi:hypothetical protein
VSRIAQTVGLQEVRRAVRYVFPVMCLCLSTTPALPQTAETGSAHGSTAICRKILERYRPLAHSHPGQRPMDVLDADGASGITTLDSNTDSGDVDGATLARWAATQKPSFSVSPDLAGDLSDHDRDGTLAKAPGVDFYAIFRLVGSENCDDSTFFYVKDGVASPADAPFPSVEGDCKTDGGFGTVDGAPVFVRQNYDYRPGMSAKIEVATWSGEDFRPSCEIDLLFSPELSKKTFNDWGDECVGRECPGLRAAAFALVQKSLDDPGALQDDAIQSMVKGLSTKQRDQFETAQSWASKSVDIGDDALLVPYVVKGRFYVVSIADFTIGWRDYADQSVKFLTVDDGKVFLNAAFAVGVWKGDLRKASVSATSASEGWRFGN